jgi:hypothetical protein
MECTVIVRLISWNHSRGSETITMVTFTGREIGLVVEWLGLYLCQKEGFPQMGQGVFEVFFMYRSKITWRD